MTSSLAWWIAAAVLLFWSVGAYNRLVRLRSDANAAFAMLDAELAKQIALVQGCMPPDETQPATLVDGQPSFWSGLHGAAMQFAASLAVARNTPLDPEATAALRAAHEVLAMAWERAEREDAHDLAGPRLPDTVIAMRIQQVAQGQAATGHFNAAVAAYNAAIAQFPAVLLSWLFGFKPGRGL
jgi:LemA protein